MSRIVAFLFAWVPMLTLAACANDSQTERLQWTLPEKRILLMPPQIDLREFESTEIAVAREDWSRIATTASIEEVRRVLTERGIALSLYDSEADPVKRSADEGQMSSPPALRKCVTEYNDNGGVSGQCALAMHTRFSADYVLLVSIKNEFTVTGKSAARCTALVGRCGGDSADGSLIDLRTGITVWSRTWGAGDRPDDGSIRKAVRDVFADFPF